jgi:hypothetical protein
VEELASGFIPTLFGAFRVWNFCFVRCLILRISGCGGQECVEFPIFACGSVLFESYLLCFVLLDSGSLSLSLSLSLFVCPRFFVAAAAGTNHKRADRQQQQEGEDETRGEVRRERSKNRSHVVEIKAFSCLPGASYPSLSDLAFQHRHTVLLLLLLLLLLLSPLPCLGLDKKIILAKHNNTMMPTTKCCPLFLSRQ